MATDSDVFIGSTGFTSPQTDEGRAPYMIMSANGFEYSSGSQMTAAQMGTWLRWPAGLDFDGDEYADVAFGVPGRWALRYGEW